MSGSRTGRVRQRVCLAAAFLVAGWALLLDVTVLVETQGSWAGVVALAVAPATLVVAPWYALFTIGHWLPFVLGYGSIIAAILTVRAGRRPSTGIGGTPR